MRSRPNPMSRRFAASATLPPRAPELREDVDILLRQHRDFSSGSGCRPPISLIHESTLDWFNPARHSGRPLSRMARDRATWAQVRFIVETGGIRIDAGMSTCSPTAHAMLRTPSTMASRPFERLAKGKPAPPRCAWRSPTGKSHPVEISDDGRGSTSRVKRRAIDSAGIRARDPGHERRAGDALHLHPGF